MDTVIIYQKEKKTQAFRQNIYLAYKVDIVIVN